MVLGPEVDWCTDKACIIRFLTHSLPVNGIFVLWAHALAAIFMVLCNSLTH